ncbi:MAG: hypothetical protein H6Q06_2366 [Acidobacteria bacterium]|nr:hypothetical protein [Acidobacteriota bacterium]
MNEKQLAKWLMDLAACYDHVPQKAAIARYLRILSRWKLSPAQWEKLGDLAVLRLTRRFPMPGELQEIAAELREEEELRANTEHLACLREKWRQQAETTADDRPGDNS